MKYFLALVFCASLLSGAEINKQLEEKLAFEKYAEVIELTGNELEKTTDRKTIADLKFYRAKALHGQGELAESFELLQELVSDYSREIDYEKVLDLQFAISNAQYEASGSSNLFGSSEEAISFYEQLIRQAPYSRGAATSMLRIGMLQQEDGDEVAAILTYNKVIVNHIIKCCRKGMIRIF